MSYSAQTFVADEQPTTAKWNLLWSNDAAFNDGSGFANGALGSVPDSFANGVALQVAQTDYASAATGTTTVPLDNSTPQNTEGDQYMTLSFTPKNAANILIVEALGLLSHSASNTHIIGALFQSGSASAIATGEDRVTVGTAPTQVYVSAKMTAGGTSAITFTFRAGGSAAGTTSFNAGVGTSPLFGTAAKSFIRVTEYRAS